jgi:type II secretory pathway component PulF
MRTWLEGLKRGLAEHLTVSESVKQHTESVPLEVSLLAAGERGGRIENSCAHLARYYELRQKSRDKAIGALVYPIILLHLGMVLPEVPNFFLQDNAVSVVSTIVWHIGIAWLLIGGTALVGLWLLKRAATSTAADGLLRSIPLVGGARRHWALARFCQVFQTGLLASFRMSETLELAGEASQSAMIRDAALRAAHSLEAGERLAPALKQTGVFPKTFMQSVATSEETGTLDREMERWAVAEAELAARAQNRLAEWMPRMLYFLIMMYVAYRIISMVYDIYGRTYGEALKMLDSV